ncbi:hypothetical protein UY286_15445 [Paenibacillus polymyxa]|uniref:hypothetical protein n=1 Tax=Paenibacillus polymyxa TaxID=1406 RepID=UPI002AB3B1A1|nr:hypothetical protein [Paenibacillus polymyxa]MDY7992390.1 hypothetical protein [Paenibacillus polymyxa]MDY8118832.1 hypothetical protein [Paenibacillus polymyxa]
MKKKTRKIIVGEKEYLYVINQKYNQHLSNISLKISLKSLKNLTCTFLFYTDHEILHHTIGSDSKPNQSKQNQSPELKYIGKHNHIFGRVPLISCPANTERKRVNSREKKETNVRIDFNPNTLHGWDTLNEVQRDCLYEVSPHDRY